jgi:hypothetical protein
MLSLALSQSQDISPVLVLLPLTKAAEQHRPDAAPAHATSDLRRVLVSLPAADPAGRPARLAA